MKSDDKVIIGAEKLKFPIAKAIAKTLLAIVNDELQQSLESKKVEKIIKQMHSDVMLT